MNNFPNQLQQQIAQAQNNLNTQYNKFAGAMRQEQQRRSDQIDQRLSDLATIAKSLSVSRQEQDGIVRIEDIPGRRVPFDYLVDIPISSNDTSQREGTIVISQEGPFVAVKRYAIFQSFAQFSSVVSSVTTRYSGRSYGRWRPISSAWDLNDSRQDNAVTTQNPFLLGTYNGNIELVSTQASARTMEFDGRIAVINQGSSFPRQNITVPSAFWATNFTDPIDLACLDFFERGEAVNFQIQPSHINNPIGGNADGANIFGTTGWPFVAGQYDKHEGIVTPNAYSTSSGTPAVFTQLVTTDSITRLYDGVLTIGLMGYRIQQPPGVG